MAKMNTDDQGQKKWKFTGRKEKLPPGMDPYLYRLVQKMKKAQESDAHADDVTAVSEWIEVIAELDDPHIEVPGLIISSLEGNIGTGRVHILDVEQVVAHDNVLVLTGARPIGPIAKKHTLETTDAEEAHLDQE